MLLKAVVSRIIIFAGDDFIMRRTKILTLSFMCIVLMCIHVYAMAKPEHSRLWNEAFGITDRTSRENIQRLWDTAQEVIDSYEVDYRDLRRNFEWFTWGSYGHRLLFHWGFNADPKQYPQLVRQVRKCLKDSPDAKTEEEKFFTYLTRNIQARKNRTLINAVISITGIPSARGYANAVATIIYDVHILGDYSTTNTSALPSIADIERDIIERGFKRLITGGEKSKMLEQIEQELNSAVRTGRGRINSRQAELLL